MSIVHLRRLFGDPTLFDRSVMTDRPICAECDKEIDGEVVWYRPLAGMISADPQTADVVGRASNMAGDGLPMHPKCFTRRTGKAWPPEV
jgi:hypothetical protein